MNFLKAGKIFDTQKVFVTGEQRADYELAKVLEGCGVRYDGIQSGKLVCFTDMKTHSSLAISKAEFSTEKVLTKIDESRARFAI